MPTNASLIVTKLNDNKGRIYKVDAPKAFKLVDFEEGVLSKFKFNISKSGYL